MSIWLILTACLLYIALLFVTAWWVDKRARAGINVIQHPYIYSLSMAVYCTAWTFFGSVGRASASGLSFLSIYLGPTLLAPLWMLILHRMIIISKHQRITSIADFISARYGKSATLAAIVTLIAVMGVVPYISIQLKAITFGINILTQNQYADLKSNSSFYIDAAFWVAMAMAVFTTLFGTRKLDPNERHEGLVAAVALESIIKLVAFFAIGFFVVYGLYNGFGDLFHQASEHPETKHLFSLQSSGTSAMSWNMLLLLSASAMLLLPRQFHIAVVENTNPSHVLSAMWMFPLYLLLINIFVLPIAFAGKMHLGADIAADTFVLTLPMSEGHNWLALIAFIGGFSAATSMVIVSSIALSIMVSNHLVVPFLIRWYPIGREGHVDGAHRLLNIRRISILSVILLAYVYLKTVGSRSDLVSVGLISFTAVAQFAPAAFAGMYWKRATYQGALAGLLVGFMVWAYTLPIPAMADAGIISNTFKTEGLFGLSWLRPQALFGLEGLDSITHAAFWSLLLNAIVYMVVSVNTQPSALTLTQADLFVNINKYVAGQESELVRREANMTALRSVLYRFLGESRTQMVFEEFLAADGQFIEGTETASTEFINFAETTLSGAIGAASARLVIDSVSKNAPITLDEIMQVLEQTQEVLRYSRALEAKSMELEATTHQLTAANDQLKTLDRLKADFVTTVTHELRTPVTSIRSISKIMHDYQAELSDEKKTGYLRILVSETERISRLINQVLDLEKIQSNHDAHLHFQPVDMQDIVYNMSEGMAQLFREKEVALHFEHDQADDRYIVNGDRDSLSRVVLNLLSNALKFAPPQYGRVDMHLERRNKTIILRISDNGPGIPLENQALIFDKFTQLNQHNTGKPEGSGLGLFISRTILGQHSGSISVKSKIGEGSVFEVKLKAMTQK